MCIRDSSSPKHYPPLALDLGDRPIVGRDLLLLQQWLGLERIEITPAGDLGPVLSRQF